MAYFWSGNQLQDFLFKGFDITSTDGLATLCVALIGSAIFYEGLRALRDGLLNKFVDTRRKELQSRIRRPARLKISSIRQQDEAHSSGSVSPPIDYGGCGDGGDASVSLMRSPLDEDDYELHAKSGDEFTALQVKTRRKENCKTFSLLVISTLFHILYINIGYCFMLAVMTFNVWILVSIAFGVGIGQLIFGVFKRSDIFTSSNIMTIRSPSGQPSSDSEVFLPSSEESVSVLDRGDMGECSTSAATSKIRVARDIGSPAVINKPSGQISDYYSNSSGSDNSHSEHLTTEITVHTSATPDFRHNASSVSP